MEAGDRPWPGGAQAQAVFLPPGWSRDCNEQERLVSTELRGLAEGSARVTQAVWGRRELSNSSWNPQQSAKRSSAPHSQLAEIGRRQPLTVGINHAHRPNTTLYWPSISRGF